MTRTPCNAAYFGIKSPRWRMAVVLAVDGLHLRRLFHPDPGTVDQRHHLNLWSLGNVLIFFYGFATYGNAGFMREQVCIYMCPYARFQSAMFDHDTLIISYDEKRGNPRGCASVARRRPRSAWATASTAGCASRFARSASISATACSTSASAAPPADVCDDVGTRWAIPARPGEIHHRERPAWATRRGDPSTHPGCTLAISRSSSAGLLYGLLTRVPLEVDIIRDRNVLYGNRYGHGAERLQPEDHQHGRPDRSVSALRFRA